MDSAIAQQRAASAPAPAGDKLAQLPAAPTIIAEACSASDCSSTAADQQLDRSDEHISGYYDLAPKEVHPFHRPAMPSQEAMRASPHHPVVVTANPMAGGQVGANARVCMSIQEDIGRFMGLRSEEGQQAHAQRGVALKRLAAEPAAAAPTAA
jgi:hypothetical protein